MNKLTLLFLCCYSGCKTVPSRPAQPDLSPEALAVLQVFRLDSVARAHVGYSLPDAGVVVERTVASPSLIRELPFFATEIARSQQCQWRGLARDSIAHLATLAARADSGRESPPGRPVALSSQTASPNPKTRDLAVFRSALYQEMRVVSVFLRETERDAAGGGLSEYASVNRGVHYLVCTGPGILEVLGPLLRHY